jgi:hypothetical protein
MCTTIDAIWTFALMLWHQHNHKLHGHNRQISVEAKCQQSLTQATAVNNNTLDKNDSHTSSIIRLWPIWLTGPSNTLTPTSPRLKWLVNRMLSLVRVYLTSAAPLNAACGGSHMVCKISLALTGDYKVSVTNQITQFWQCIAHLLPDNLVFFMWHVPFFWFPSLESVFHHHTYLLSTFVHMVSVPAFVVTIWKKCLPMMIIPLGCLQGQKTSK